jgi:aryl-alcohol dehydrogenase-like predicted oxidoreductase
VRSLQNEGLIRFAGLSEVSVEDIQAASKYFKVATVQNRYNLSDRASEDVLEHCEKHGIGFIPWYPLAAGSLTQADSPLQKMAAARNVSAGQIALAWLLNRSPVMFPGTSKRTHLRENVAAAEISLSDREFAELEALR